MGNRICPGCGNLMLLDNDDYWYCDDCGYTERIKLLKLSEPAKEIHIDDNIEREINLAGFFSNRLLST